MGTPLPPNQARQREAAPSWPASGGEAAPPWPAIIVEAASVRGASLDSLGPNSFEQLWQEGQEDYRENQGEEADPCLKGRLILWVLDVKTLHMLLPAAEPRNNPNQGGISCHSISS